MKNLLGVLFGLIMLSSCDYCKLLGEEDLGGNFSLIEGDSKDDVYINYCTSKGCCNVGIYTVPSKVLEVNYDDKWILAKSFNSDSINYWIINKNFELDLEECRDKNCVEIINSNVIGPLDKLSFLSQKESLSIGLTLSD